VFPAYIAKPDPAHIGDLDGRGVSNVLLTSEGYNRLMRARPGAQPGAAELEAPPPAKNWMATAGAGALALVLVALYLDGRGR
jgi:hypothetical protein